MMRRSILIQGLTAIAAMFLSLSSATASSTPLLRIVLEKNAASSLSVGEKQAVERFISEASLRLPEKLRQDLGGDVEVEFVDTGMNWMPQCEARPSVFPRVSSRRGRRVRMERALLGEILKGEAGAQTFSCGHGNGYRHALAALLHEVARLYDDANLQLPEIQHEIVRCRSPRARYDRDPDARCARFRGINRTLSKNPMFQTLLGAAEIGAIFPTRREGEVVSFRSPDLSEFKDAEEGFAVNFEYFLLAPEYGCRRPTLARFFARQMGWDPFPLRPCQTNHVVPISREEMTETMIHFARLDPSRLYQVHYLFASKGEETMSRWGHAMFRLVFCSPSRKEPGPDCLKDLSYHVVVSFRANVQGLEIQGLKGLRGDYPSQLYLLSLVEVMREYATDELRDLVSLPLKLTAEQQREFLDRSIQMFWEYRGRYMFLSNNCATEALNLLKSVYPDGDFQAFTHVLSPIGLYQELKSNGLMDDQILSDTKLAAAQGYFFPSERGRLDRSFRSIVARAEARGAPLYQDLEDFIKQSSASERSAWFSRMDEGTEEGQRGVMAAEFFVLESYLLRYRQAEFYKQVAELLQRGKVPDLDPDGALKKNIERARAFQERVSPQGLTVSGYGIPLVSDFRPTLEQDVADARAEFVQVASELRKALEKQFPVRFEELLKTAANRTTFAKAMARPTSSAVSP